MSIYDTNFPLAANLISGYDTVAIYTYVVVFYQGFLYYDVNNVRIAIYNILEINQPHPRGPPRFRFTPIAPGIKWKSVAKSM